MFPVRAASLAVTGLERNQKQWDSVAPHLAGWQAGKMGMLPLPNVFDLLQVEDLAITLGTIFRRKKRKN